MEPKILKTIRGDSFKFQFKIIADSLYAIITDSTDSNSYLLGENDAVYLGIMAPHQPFEDARLKRKFTKEDQVDGLISVNFKPEETINLEYGIYYYCIKLLQNAGTANETVTTVLNKTKLIVND